ncbi:MAG: Holliday junction branch migration protein RuvA [Candidatus Margulisiibacteriota bacterium]|nr:MAG: Holliday junction DNA helicase RuvA [Candidatus Margulisbacteria bacterium GWD2_39_127]OGI03329.1 MAG: Holliday junction DNA helicase RuvA [Candidatus Margulisbacteria bacterium GWF2_38_17]OGI12013.1 MAG: Holliday junction DNA helicase RuvA [Candidatus Margulisbacteria bacterium GWE2_39_32]PZM77040.1 MAG: Holliday junction branch migration protein RuvA [Candidatus Margulisiibacteriota bacterium]HAR63173.1 Holliday junction branch migration protein RuvA [Candidatus Margulisiibacteriota b
MIYYLEGKIIEVEIDSIIMDVGGIGYEVFVSANFIKSLPSGIDFTKVYIYHHFREDGQALYGFVSKKDKEIFKQLISISGIGPKGAMTMMSNLETDRIIEAIVNGDALYLSSAPGIGKKTAARLILELKGKLANVSAEFEVDIISPKDHLITSIKNDTVSALMSLGYNSREIQKTLNAFSEEDRSAIKSTEDCIKVALQRIKNY